MIVSIIAIIVGAGMILYGCYLLCLILICKKIDNDYLFTEEQVERIHKMIDNNEFLEIIRYTKQYGVLEN